MQGLASSFERKNGQLFFKLTLPNNSRVRHLPLMVLEGAEDVSSELTGEIKSYCLFIEPVGEELTSFLTASASGVKKIVEDLANTIN